MSSQHSSFNSENFITLSLIKSKSFKHFNSQLEKIEDKDPKYPLYSKLGTSNDETTLEIFLISLAEEDNLGKTLEFT